MSDSILRAMLAPTNMVFITSRWADGTWQIHNMSTGHEELYSAMAWADQNYDGLRHTANSLVRLGAVASEVKILRPTFQEIETICEGVR